MIKNDFFTVLSPQIPTDQIQYLDQLKNNLEYYNPKQKFSLPNNVKLNFTDDIHEAIVPRALLESTLVGNLIDILDNNDISVKFFKFPPHYHVCWHRDFLRRAGINIPINHYNSVTLFAKDIDDPENANKNTQIVSLSYELGKLYLFNTARFHCVTNLSDDSRYILSVFLPPEMHYLVTYNKLKSNNWVS